MSTLDPTRPYIMPVVIDELSPSDERIPASLRELQWIAAPGGDLPDAALEQLAQALQASAQIADEVQTTRQPDPLDLFQILAPDVVREAVLELIHALVRVLVVNGPPQSAVSEVERIVEQLRGERFAHTIVDLATLRGAYTGLELAEDIAWMAGLDTAKMPRIEDVSRPRAARELALWLVSSVERAGSNRILSLRGFDASVVSEEAFDLVSEIIALVGRSKGLLRLLLVNLTRPLSASDEAMIRRVTLEPVGRWDVHRYFTLLLERTGRPFDPAAAEQAADSVFDSLAEEAWEYDDLRRRLTDAARLLIREQP